MDSFKSSTQLSLDSSFDDSLEFPGSVTKTQPNGTNSVLQDERQSLVHKVIEIYLKHNITLECLSDWVHLLNTRLEDCEKLPEGKVELLNLFRNNLNPVDVFFFVKCAKCLKGTKIQSNQKTGASCSHCDELLKMTETNFFVIIPIQQQIMRSVQKNWKQISSFDTSDKNDKCFSDAHDGEILRTIMNRYEDTDVNILSLCLNVDGANKFKSNSLSVWPIQLTQNFLPPFLRFLPENIILNGLFYHKSDGDTELNFRVYMRPLIDELNQIKNELITMDIGNENYQFRSLITHCAVDLPAKSKIQETKQFGGYNACTYCDIPGELVLIKKSSNEKKNNETNASKKNNKTNKQSGSVDKAGSRSFVRYVEGEEEYEERNETGILKAMMAVAGSNGKKSIDGVKDISCLVGLDHFNIIWSIGVEYMHCCLLGVEKRLLQLFLNSKYSDKDHYIVPAKRKLLNKRLLAITPTSSITRKPRPLTQLASFKASEYRSLLLYYLPICLPGCLPKKYVNHIRQFSAAVYILLKKRISYEEVNEAEQMLYSFVKRHQELFGKQAMVMVVHLLKHLAQSVRKLGPLWTHSAFPFERNNGCLLKLANGTTHVLHQISSKYCLKQALHDRDENDEYDVKILLGKVVIIKESATSVFDYSSMDIVNLANVSLSVYTRVKYKQIIYTSRMYTRPKRSIDYFIGLKNGVMGTAKYYFTYMDKVCVMLLEYEAIDTVNHINKVLPKNRLILASIDEIEKKYLFMKVGFDFYVTCRPNPYENE